MLLYFHNTMFSSVCISADWRIIMWQKYYYLLQFIQSIILSEHLLWQGTGPGALKNTVQSFSYFLLLERILFFSISILHLLLTCPL